MIKPKAENALFSVSFSEDLADQIISESFQFSGSLMS
jgi:hypothetical protein